MNILLFFMWCVSFLVPEARALDNRSTLSYVINSTMYDKYDAPVVEGKAVKIHVYIDIMDIDNIDEGNMDFKIQMFLQEIWRDPRCQLDYYTERSKKEKANIGLPSPIVEELWKPDIVFDNAKTGVLFQLSIPNTGVKVMPNGEFMRNSRYNLRVSCQMDLHLYPMDTQHCFMMVSLFGHPDRKAKLYWISHQESPYRSNYPTGIHYTKYIQPLKFTILPPASHSVTLTWSNGDFTNLYANFTFVRRLSGSIVIVYIPSTLVVCLSWTSFWLDVNAAPARTTLGVTSLLTLATQVVQARGQLPPVNYMTALDVWLFVCIIAVFFSILEFAISYQVYQNNNKSEPHTINNVVPQSWQTNNIRIRRDSGCRRRGSADDVSPDLLQQRKTKTSFVKYEGLKKICSSNLALDSFSRRFFPTLFSLFVIVYWIVYGSIS